MKKTTTLLFTLSLLLIFSSGVLGQTLYSEDFTGQNGKGATGTSIGTTFDTTGVDWVIDVGATLETDGTTNSFEVDSEAFIGDDVDGNGDAGDGIDYAYWYSPVIDVSSVDGVDLSIDLDKRGNGANSSGESLNIYYSNNPSSGSPTYTLIKEYDQNSMGSLPETLNELNIDVSSTSEFRLRIGMDANGAGDGFSFDDITVVENTLKSEPANHATSFSVSGSINSADLSWTDATGSPLPDAYLIKVSNVSFGAISSPSDASSVSDDLDISDGSGALNVAFGEESASFTGLDETTTYYFKIYPYTNSGSDIDYKTDGTVPEDDATTLETPDIVINEILADPDGDANGDGTTDTGEDEFLEFVNTGTTELDISDWTVEDANGTTHTFTNPTVLKPLQAVVIFGGGTPTGDFGGALTQTAGGLSLNNGGDDVILKNDSGIEIINYTYSGATDQSETRSPDLTGDFEDHETADTDDASSFSPGTRIDGTYFQPSVEITGNAGWRLLSLPIEDGTVADISDNTAVQGISGGDNAGADPNLFINTASDGTGQNGYTTPTNVTTPWGDGLGFIIFFYDNSSNGSSELPIILDAFGTEPSGDVDVTISDTWTLVGNPFTSNFELDQLTGNDSGEGVNDGLVSPASFWDDGIATDESGSWITENFGSSNGEVISTWSGFFIQRNSGSTTQLTFPGAGKTSDVATASYFSKEKTKEFREIELLLEAPDNQVDRSLKLYFSNQSIEGRDGFDGGKLIPLNGSPFISFINDFGKGSELFVQDARPLNPETEQKYELALGDEGVRGTYTLSWPEMTNIPDDWSFTLTDFETGNTMNMIPGSSYEFNVEAVQKVRTVSVLNLAAMEASAEEVNSRFSITLKTSTTTSTEKADEPQTFALKQNYPNPFNPNTTIEYSVSKSATVTLTVYNVMGQQVATLVNETKPVGTYRVSWNAADMASGIYHYRLQAGNQVMIHQMTLIK
ncbi:lamin tail domain-containing protein [Gracilimonas sediminicola]|uniref:Lamin tail domain-containing protein n=1 Tax=Gracilimonas sediminicola TaxID=2952158 RepID=A0A9X2L0X8_9BACT|nr:lamin tail domain-containing protein [Gracilimonas sediminicola]MCP9290311.1 lamin tail domain-containing protein [Gracilimonas sediminicola]